MFRLRAGITPSENVVRARLPTVATGHLAADAAPVHGADVAASGQDQDDALFGGVWATDSDSDDSDSGDRGRAGSSSTQTHLGAESGVNEAEAAGRAAMARSRDVDDAGVPRPLSSGLVTLSGEAGSKWESLVHLNAIKVRFAVLQDSGKHQCAAGLTSSTAG
jgi:hypothetical protein